MRSTLLFFIDGVGIGENNPSKNPFVKYGFKTFQEIFGAVPTLDNPALNSGSAYLFPVNATLGVAGFPQSGTGQTTIFTGENAAQLLGAHFGPYPHSHILPLLSEKNIFRFFQERKLESAFANAYPQPFFDYLNSGKKRTSASSTMCLASGIRLRTITDLQNGKALTAEIDNSRWISKLNYDLPEISVQSAAERLLELTRENQFTLYEYYLTDHFGHGRNLDYFEEAYKKLDEFLFHILSHIDDAETTFLLCSDHGNFEDMSIKTHTYNPAIAISAGKDSKLLFEKIKDLTHIKSAITALYP